MYVNINRYLKIYLSNPPYTYIGPRANTWELTIDKIDKFEPRNVNDYKILLILFMFFATFSAFLCYRRKFSVFFTFGEDSGISEIKEKKTIFSLYFARFVLSLCPH